MATYSTDIELGVSAGVALVPNFDAYIERTSGTSVGDSLNDITAAATGNNAELTANTGSLTGRNLTYFCTSFEGGDVNNSSPILFENSSIHITGGQANWNFPLTLTDVDIYDENTGSHTIGTAGNGSGTYGVYDADGHVTTAGTNARGISRPWNLTNVRLFGNGGAQFICNGARPGQSSFSNVDFNPANGRGMFGELPFLSFPDARWGTFYRPNFPNPGDNPWARLTGGMDRNDIDIATNWMIQPQWDIRNLDGETAQVAVDGRCFVYFVNFVLPADATNLMLRGGQGTSTTDSGQNGATRIISAYGWNPLVNGGTNDIKYVFTGFNVHSVPATFTGGNTDGTAVQPTVFTSGSTEPADFNGLFIIQEDTGTLTSNALASGTAITQYTPRDIHLFSYDTQINALNGNAFVQNFGRAITLTPNAHGINADLTWRAQEVIDEPTDVFLNGVALTTDFTQQLTTLDHIYPTLKSIAFSNEDRGDDRFRIVPSEGGLRFSANVTFSTTANNEITSAGGNFIVRLDLNAGTSLVSTLDFRPFDGHSADTVDWGDNTRTFTGPISILGGQHSNFPTDWTNGLTFASSVTITRPAAATVLDWTNVQIPDGVTVNFPGAGAFSIGGLSAAEQGRVTGAGITFLANTNTVTPMIPAGYSGDGRFVVKQVGGAVVSARDITGGVLGGTDFEVAEDDTASYVAYYKLDGAFNTPTVDYQIAIFPFTGVSLTGNTTVAPIEVPPVFTGALTAAPTNQIATFTPSTGANINLVWSGDAINNAQLTASNIIVAKNEDAWIDWHAANDFTVEQYELGPGSGGAWQTSVTFTSDTGAQRTVTQQSDFTRVQAGTSPNTYDQVISVNVGNAPISVVIAAVDASNTAIQVGDIHNFNGNLSGNPLLTAPQGGFDRTNRTYGTGIEE